MSNFLFVYGTLKKEFRANFLLEKEKFISNAITVNKFCMISSEFGNYPLLYNDISNLGTQIFGEVYSVSDDKLMELDVYEGVPTLYERKNITVEIDNKKLIDVFVYIATDNIDITSSKNLLSIWEEVDIFNYVITCNSNIENILQSKCPDSRLNGYIFITKDKYSLWKVSDIDTEILKITFKNNLQKQIESILNNDEEIEVLKLNLLVDYWK